MVMPQGCKDKVENQSFVAKTPFLSGAGDWRLPEIDLFLSKFYKL